MNYSSDSFVRARAYEAAQENSCLRFEDGAECDAAFAGALSWSAELPTVEDWGRARRADATLALIENVERRTTCISHQCPGGGGNQVLAANVDQPTLSNRAIARADFPRNHEMVIKKKTTKALCAGMLALAMWPWSGAAQTTGAAILRIDIANYVPYHYDVFDHQKFATAPTLTPTTTPPGMGRAFDFFVFIGDIVAVNGKPAKGLWTARTAAFGFGPNAAPGQSIADVTRLNVIDMYWEILQVDGTPIGTLAASGMTRGSPPPGAPLAVTGDNMNITGGTGAYLGARGQAGIIDQGSPRQASVVEDPAYRRIIGGARRSYVAHVIPMFVPQIITTANGPAVTHSSDFSLVTASKPAAAGEILSLFATGLGPTVPGVDPGQPRPSSPLVSVNSPVEVTVNGKPAEVLAAVGYPGTADGYQVNFRLPTDTAKGMAILQVSAAWITGPPVSIVIQ